MKAVFFFILVSTLLLLPCSAEEINFDILQNSQGEYFIEYNEDLISCANDTCTIEVANYTTNTTELELSRDDMKKIAQYVSLEIGTVSSGGINETFFIEQSAKGDEWTANNIKLWITETIEFSLDEKAAMQNEISSLERDVYDLELNMTMVQSEAIRHDSVLSSKEAEIESKDMIIWILVVLTFVGFFAFLAVTAVNSTAFKRMLELRRSK